MQYTWRDAAKVRSAAKTSITQHTRVDQDFLDRVYREKTLGI